jgi:hypothetical protein
LEKIQGKKKKRNNDKAVISATESISYGTWHHPCYELSIWWVIGAKLQRTFFMMFSAIEHLQSAETGSGSVPRVGDTDDEIGDGVPFCET